MSPLRLLGTAVLLAAYPCSAQNWSLGAAGGFGVYHDVTITTGSASAQAGFRRNFAAGAVLGEDSAGHFGGELRYNFRKGDSELRSGGREVSLDAAAHALHYDFLLYATNRRAQLRPFVAAGAGIKRYTATGQEPLSQPLIQFATLRHADEVKALISFGGGVKASLGEHWLLRVDFRDYATPFPRKLITPGQDAKIHGWLHDFVPMFGLDWRFGKR
jgi:outer membrane protein with beta-barrel domain